MGELPQNFIDSASRLSHANQTRAAELAQRALAQSRAEQAKLDHVFAIAKLLGPKANQAGVDTDLNLIRKTTKEGWRRKEVTKTVVSKNWRVAVVETNRGGLVENGIGLNSSGNLFVYEGTDRDGEIVTTESTTPLSKRLDFLPDWYADSIDRVPLIPL